jgi:hypothetical protein
MIEGLTFNEEKHQYAFQGKPVPGVTTALQVLGGYAGIPKHILDNAARRGTAVHRATELYDDGTLDYSTLDDEIYPYLTAWEQFLHDKKPEIIEVETVVYHPKFGYAGTLDRGLILDGERGILDIKSCVEMQRSTGPQTAAYLAARNERIEDKKLHYKKRWGLQLKKDGTYEIHPYKDAGDLNVFLSCLTVYKFLLRK